MGFGLLFIGYFLTVINVPILGIWGTLIRVCGIGVMTMGTVKLIKYNKAFTYTSVGIALMAGMTALILFTDVNKLLYDNLLVSREIFSDNAKMIVQYVEQGVSFVFNALLLWGIYSIAKETEVKKICNGAIRNFIFSCAHIGAFLLSFVPTKGIQSVKWEFSIIIWILYFANILLNLVLLFSCYANICDADDVEMERKPSKMPILNRIYDENERRMKKARESDALYRMERRRKIEERRNKRRKK